MKKIIITLLIAGFGITGAVAQSQGNNGNGGGNGASQTAVDRSQGRVLSYDPTTKKGSLKDGVTGENIDFDAAVDVHVGDNVIYILISNKVKTRGLVIVRQ